MDAPIVVGPAAGEIVGDAPDRRVEILCDHAALHATWSRFGPRRDGADLHVHREHADLFYVLAGELTVRLGPAGDPVPVPAGGLAHVPAGVVHGFRNAADSEVRYLNLHAPGRGFADYLRALRDGRRCAYDQHDPPADGGRSPAEAETGGAEALGGGRGRLLADAEAIAVAELDGVADAAPHVHDRHVECLYVLAGEAVVRAAGRDLRAPAGAWVRLPPGLPHAVAAADARVLCVRAPGCGWGAHLRAPAADAFDEREAA